jgi:2-phosphosulfolactate phosphatase
VIAALEGADVQVVCAGSDGAVALEDVYVAGRICARLPGRRTDAARVAEGVARAYPTPPAALAHSAGAEALRSADLAGDIADCARESTLEAVGRVQNTAPGVASVVDATATVERCRAPSFSA